MVLSMVAVVCLSALGLHAAGLTRFSVTQVRQLDVGAPVVRAYLDLTDADDQAVAALPESSLTATLGEWPAEPINVVPFSTVRQGVAYVFLVDISRSLSPELFQRMVGGIETWIAGMGPSDRAALIAFGESSDLIVDYTGDQEELLTGLASLGPTDDLTLLHQALADALEISRRLDADLPGRRALVIFSDGKDEGSSFEAEDVLARLRDDPSPIYSIGYSRLRDPAERRSYLNLLQRFSSNSGGVFFAAEETRFEEAYESIRQAIRRVWVADFLCTDCRTDGSLHRLQVRVDLNGQVMTSGGSVRLLPLVGAAPPPEATPPAPEIVTPPVEQPEVPVQIETEPDSGFGFWWILLAVILATAAVWYLRRHLQRSGAPTSPPPATYYPPVPPPPLEPRQEPRVLDPPMPMPRPGEGTSPRAAAPAKRRRARAGSPPKQVRLIVVQGSRKGRQYSFVVSDRAIVGRRSSCDCVLAEEIGIDAQQFELLNIDEGLAIENLSDRRPTLVAGHPLTGRDRLASDTLIGTGETVLRIIYH